MITFRKKLIILISLYHTYLETISLFPDYKINNLSLTKMVRKSSWCSQAAFLSSLGNLIGESIHKISGSFLINGMVD